MAEDNSVFLCNSCKPFIDVPGNHSTSTSVDNFRCKVCNFKSTFKYNLKRHVDRQHNGDNQPHMQAEYQENVEEVEGGIEPSLSNIEDTCETTLEDILNELDLSIYLKNFQDEGVDMDMLLSMTTSFEIKDCLKEIGIKRFGDRHNISEKVLIVQRKSKKTNSSNELTNNQNIESDHNNSIVNESNKEKKKTKNADQDGGDEAIPIDGGDEAIPIVSIHA